MQGVLNVLTAIWEFFTTYILRNAPFMIGFITLLGYALMRKKWYDILSGTLKAIIGMLILNVGSGGLVSNFRPILAGLKDRFNLVATVIDPYYGQNAVTAGVEEQFGAAFSSAVPSAQAKGTDSRITAAASRNRMARVQIRLFITYPPFQTAFVFLRKPICLHKS